MFLASSGHAHRGADRAAFNEASYDLGATCFIKPVHTDHYACSCMLCQ